MQDGNKRLDYEEERRKLALEHGERDYLLSLFGDRLAKARGYQGLDGFDAIHYYLVQKHHWLPAQVRAMTTEDLAFALHEERQRLPGSPAAADPVHKA